VGAVTLTAGQRPAATFGTEVRCSDRPPGGRFLVSVCSTLPGSGCGPS